MKCNFIPTTSLSLLILFGPFLKRTDAEVSVAWSHRSSFTPVRLYSMMGTVLIFASFSSIFRFRYRNSPDERNFFQIEHLCYNSHPFHTTNFFTFLPRIRGWRREDDDGCWIAIPLPCLNSEGVHNMILSSFQRGISSFGGGIFPIPPISSRSHSNHVSLPCTIGLPCATLKPLEI